MCSDQDGLEIDYDLRPAAASVKGEQSDQTLARTRAPREDRRDLLSRLLGGRR
jgi:hypothetical protein